jgi:hypothetical protein
MRLALPLPFLPFAKVRAALHGDPAGFPHVEAAEGVRLGRPVLILLLILVPVPFLGRRLGRMAWRNEAGERAQREPQEEVAAWPGAAQYARDMIEVLGIHTMLISFLVTSSEVTS